MDSQFLRDWIRRRIEPAPTYPELRTTAWSYEFEWLMRNRLIVGALRYHKTPASKQPNCKCAREAIRRIKEYLDTGNAEGLVDAANYCLLEYTGGGHPKWHFKTIQNRHKE